VSALPTVLAIHLGAISYFTLCRVCRVPRLPHYPGRSRSASPNGSARHLSIHGDLQPCRQSSTVYMAGKYPLGLTMTQDRAVLVLRCEVDSGETRYGR